MEVSGGLQGSAAVGDLAAEGKGGREGEGFVLELNGVSICAQKPHFFPSTNSKGWNPSLDFFFLSFFLVFNEQTEEQPSGLAKLREADI